MLIKFVFISVATFLLDFTLPVTVAHNIYTFSVSPLPANRGQRKVKTAVDGDL